MATSTITNVTVPGHSALRNRPLDSATDRDHLTARRHSARGFDGLMTPAACTGVASAQVVSVDHFVPSQRSISVLFDANPTAWQLALLAHATPSSAGNASVPDEVGSGSIDQVDPFQCSISAREPALVVVTAKPTA